MDPQACWNEIKALLIEYDQNNQDILAQEDIRLELVIRLAALVDWLNRGGVPPKP